MFGEPILPSGESARISFELYPPRTPAGTAAVCQTVRRLVAADPRFLSVTYPSTYDGRVASRHMLERVLRDTPVPAVAHLTVAGSSRELIDIHIRRLVRLGARHFLALRGDPEPGREWEPHPDGLDHATDLVRMLREVEARLRAEGALTEPLTVGVAVHPHACARDREQELDSVTAKAAAGADYAITQVFYELPEYLDLVAGARQRGVTLPILPGIIPLTDVRRLDRLAAMSGVLVPDRLRRLLAEADEGKRFELGIAATADLVEGALAAGAPGAHIFTFNQADPTLALWRELLGRGLIAPSRQHLPAGRATNHPTDSQPTPCARPGAESQKDTNDHVPLRDDPWLPAHRPRPRVQEGGGSALVRTR